MLKTLDVLPVSFWVAAILLVVGGVLAVGRLREGIGLPMLAVLGTVGAWYVGDAFYNNYAERHAMIFSSETLDNAWWQVAWFILIFLILAPMLHLRINARYLLRTSHVCHLIQKGPMDPRFQFRLNQLFWGTAAGWAVLVVIAFARLGGDQIAYYFFPFLGLKADPWGRGRLGAGFDSLLVVAGHLQLLFSAMFGLVAALAKDRRVRWLAIAGTCLSWPGYIFDRTRNTLLAVVVPGILAWVFVRLRFGWMQKLAFLAGFFLLINAWLAFVIANRSDISIAAAINGGGVSLKDANRDSHHEGLNMFEELCWINQFIADDEYQINWGKRYFSEIVNPIPRSIWPGKPMIGIDYAVVRGQTSKNGAETDASGVFATISTGMIGQGVVNFGLILGPAFAALLMALWAAMLARLDLCGDQIGNIPLYALGMILTFNLGRDITLITLYTFVFGLGLVWLLRRFNRQHEPRRMPRKLGIA